MLGRVKRPWQAVDEIGGGMPGVGFTSARPGQARADRLALEPYWGEAAVRACPPLEGPKFAKGRREISGSILPDLGSAGGRHVSGTDISALRQHKAPDMLSPLGWDGTRRHGGA